MLHTFKILCALVLSLLLHLSAHAVDDCTADRDELSARLSAQSDNLTWIVDCVAFDRAAKFVLGPHYHRSNSKMRDEFVKSYGEVLRKFLTDELSTLQISQIEVIDKVYRSARDSILAARVYRLGHDPVEVRLRIMNLDGRWFVVDVQVFGVWLLIEQRAQIGSMIEQENGDLRLVADRLARVVSDE